MDVGEEGDVQDVAEVAEEVLGPEDLFIIIDDDSGERLPVTNQMAEEMRNWRAILDTVAFPERVGAPVPGQNGPYEPPPGIRRSGISPRRRG